MGLVPSTLSRLSCFALLIIFTTTDLTIAPALSLKLTVSKSLPDSRELRDSAGAGLQRKSTEYGQDFLSIGSGPSHITLVTKEKSSYWLLTITEKIMRTCLQHLLPIQR